MIWLSLCVGYPSFEAVMIFLWIHLKEGIYITTDTLFPVVQREGWTLVLGARVFGGCVLHTKNAVIACDNHENEAENESS